MIRSIAFSALVVITSCPATAQGQVSKVPDELQRFNGMLIGRLVSKDVEKGSFVATIDHVPRVWRNSRAKNPRTAVGKRLAVHGVFGKWLDALLLIQPGETIEFEARHDGGDQLTFPGEWLRKTEPFRAADYPAPPDDFRGFHGVVIGKVVRKNNELGEVVIKVERIADTMKESQAEDPQSALGKPILLSGLWGKIREPLLDMKVGDSIKAAVLHRSSQSDHFSPGELLTIITVDIPPPSADDSAIPAGMHGFRGILVGTLVKKDPEAGTLVFKAERVTRTWRQNKAPNTKSCQGRTFTVTGITGRYLDVLLEIDAGDRIEVEAFHNGGDTLHFPGELLKKIE